MAWFVDVKQVAEMKGVTPDTVRRWIRQGKLPATLWGSTYMIRRTDLDKVEPGKPGRPKKDTEGG